MDAIERSVDRGLDGKIAGLASQLISNLSEIGITQLDRERRGILLHNAQLPIR